MSTFTLEKKMKIWPPPLLSKSPNFEFWTFWCFFLTPLPPCGLFPLFGTFFKTKASLMNFIEFVLFLFYSYFLIGLKKTLIFSLNFDEAVSGEWIWIMHETTGSYMVFPKQKQECKTFHRGAFVSLFVKICHNLL